MMRTQIEYDDCAAPQYVFGQPTNPSSLVVKQPHPKPQQQQHFNQQQCIITVSIPTNSNGRILRDKRRLQQPPYVNMQRKIQWLVPACLLLIASFLQLYLDNDGRYYRNWILPPVCAINKINKNHAFKVSSLSSSSSSSHQSFRFGRQPTILATNSDSQDNYFSTLLLVEPISLLTSSNHRERIIIHNKRQYHPIQNNNNNNINVRRQGFSRRFERRELLKQQLLDRNSDSSSRMMMMDDYHCSVIDLRGGGSSYTPDDDPETNDNSNNQQTYYSDAQNHQQQQQEQPEDDATYYSGRQQRQQPQDNEDEQQYYQAEVETVQSRVDQWRALQRQQQLQQQQQQQYLMMQQQQQQQQQQQPMLQSQSRLGTPPLSSLSTNSATAGMVGQPPPPPTPNQINPLIASVSNSARAFIFFILMWRIIHLYETADRTFSGIARLVMVIPLCFLFLGNLIGMILSIITNNRTISKTASATTKKRLKAILNLDKFIEIILIFYYVLRLTIFPPATIPLSSTTSTGPIPNTKELYVASILHSVFFLLQSHTYTKLSWNDNVALAATVPPLVPPSDTDTTATNTDYPYQPNYSSYYDDDNINNNNNNNDDDIVNDYYTDDTQAPTLSVQQQQQQQPPSPSYYP